MSFAKLDSGIVNSTLWVQPDDVLRVWIWMLSQADAQGVVRTAAPALALVCMKSVDRIREILALLEAPDPDSRSENDDGRRIRKIEGGWQIINYGSYRQRVSAEEKRENDRIRIAEKRAAERAAKAGVDGCSDVSQPVASVVKVAQAEAEVEAEELETSSLVQPRAARGRFEEFWTAYPKKVGRKPCETKWKAKRLDAHADTILADIANRLANDGRWLDGFIPNPSTYLAQERWTDDLQPRRDAPKAAPAFKPDTGPSPARASETPLERAVNWAIQQHRYGQIDDVERDRLIAKATEEHREAAHA